MIAPLDYKSVAKTRVLFLCIGNACRSPMAEAFARTYGADVLVPQSAGLAPALAVVPLTHHVMLEKNIDLRDSYPKELEHVEGEIDLLINMSGYDVPAHGAAQIEVWKVRDPIGESEEVFRQVRDEIEQRVLQLIDQLRRRDPASSETLSDPAASEPLSASASPVAKSASPPVTAEVDTQSRPTRQ